MDILAYAMRYDTWCASVRYATRLAARVDARVTGMYVRSSAFQNMPRYCSQELLNTIIANVHKFEQTTDELAVRFAAWTRERGVAQSAWQLAEGYEPAVLSHAANWHDLLVLERDPDAVWGGAGALGALLLSAGLPTVVVPATEDGPVELRCIALAWNGSPESIRAAHAALPLLKRAGRVEVLVGERRDPWSETGWRPPFDIGRYLEQHGISFGTRNLDTDDAQAGAALLGAADDLDADLLVMGAYGRMRFSEWVLGGATRHVLAHAEIPVLLRH